jgi:transposase-like protein
MWLGSAYEVKFPKAIQCLTKDKDQLFQFYNFPAEHWCHIRTTNPIESTFATVRHRTKKSKNCFSRQTILASVFKLFIEAKKRWKPLKGKNRIAEIIALNVFVDGINQNQLTILNDKDNHDKQNLAA